MNKPIRGGAAAAVAFAVAQAIAASAAWSAEQTEVLEEVQVTGSRITQSPGMFTPTPVTSVTSQDMESLGPNQIIDSLSALPVFRNNSNANQSLGGQNSGGSNVNLHGAGTATQVRAEAAVRRGCSCSPRSSLSCCSACTR